MIDTITAVVLFGRNYYGFFKIILFMQHRLRSMRFFLMMHVDTLVQRNGLEKPLWFLDRVPFYDEQDLMDE